MDGFVHRLIWLETSHALHFCFDKTEVKRCLFRECTPAEFDPVLPNSCIAEIAEITQNQIHIQYRM